MDEQLRTGVVVGLDGSEGSRRAVQFAALDAERRGAGLTLVHVVPDLKTTAPPQYLVPDDLRRDVEATARALLADATETATQTAPGVPLTQAMPAGRPVSRLLHESLHAIELVVGRETVSPVHRLATGAVTLGAAARAARPVVSVPASWVPGPRHKVVAGYKSTPHSGELLATAFAEAAARDARLVLVHTWALDGLYDDRIVTRTRRDEWSRAAREGIERDLAGLRREYPAVRVEVRALHGPASHTLAEEGADADLLVLMRRAHGFPPAAHLGSTARGVLHTASCPVLVLPSHHHEHGTEGTTGATADEPLAAGTHR